MPELDPLADLLLLLSLWLGGLLLAAARLFQWRRLGMVAAVTMLVLPAVSALAGWPVKPLLPAAVMGAVLLLVEVWQRLPQRMKQLAVSRAVQSAVLFAVPMIACGLIFSRTDESPLPEEYESVPSQRGPGEPVSRPAYTDRGQQIRLLTHRPEEFPSDDIRAAEKRMGDLFTLGIIRTALPDSVSNCHGWVFTDGNFWVQNDDVESIVRDNDYLTVEKPNPGDLVVYRNANGTPHHTGIVRLVQNQLVLIESKWGPLGRYLHPVQNQPYGADWTYHRSARQGHVLSDSDPTIVATP